MNITKHTPGPWHVQPDPQYIGGHPLHQNRFITCGNPDITSDEWVNDPNSYIIASMRDCQNQQANARLIAAAPDLLEACKTVLTMLSSMDKGPITRQAWHKESFESSVTQAFQMLESSITKAEGQP